MKSISLGITFWIFGHSSIWHLKLNIIVSRTAHLIFLIFFLQIDWSITLATQKSHLISEFCLVAQKEQQALLYRRRLNADQLIFPSLASITKEIILQQPT